METQVNVSVAKPGDHPYWRWLLNGNAVLHFPGWGSLAGPLTIFDARDGSVLTQVRLDCEEIVPFEPQPTRVFVDAGKAFTWDDAVARKQCPARWHTVHFDAALYTLYLSTSRPAGDPFLFKPPEDTPKLFNPVLASLDAIIWTLSKISGESPPDPEQMPASVRCKTREEWVGVRLRENWFAENARLRHS